MQAQESWAQLYEIKTPVTDPKSENPISCEWRHHTQTPTPPKQYGITPHAAPTEATKQMYILARCCLVHLVGARQGTKGERFSQLRTDMPSLTIRGAA